MARKKTSAAKKAVGIRGGTSKQHARAGRLGGLAPHVCRGSECTKLRKEAAAKKAGRSKTAVSALSKKAAPKKRVTAASALAKRAKAAHSRYEHLYEEKTMGIAKRGRPAAKKAAPRALKAKTAGRKRSADEWGIFEGLFENNLPKRGVAGRTKKAATTKKAAPIKKAAAKRGAPAKKAVKAKAKRRRSMF